MTITRNLYRDQLRSSRTSAARHVELQDTIADGAPGADVHVQHASTLRDVRARLRRVARGDRRALLLYVREGNVVRRGGGRARHQHRRGEVAHLPGARRAGGAAAADSRTEKDDEGHPRGHLRSAAGLFRRRGERRHARAGRGVLRQRSGVRPHGGALQDARRRAAAQRRRPPTRPSASATTFHAAREAAELPQKTRAAALIWGFAALFSFGIAMLTWRGPMRAFYNPGVILGVVFGGHGRAGFRALVPHQARFLVAPPCGPRRRLPGRLGAAPPQPAASGRLAGKPA